VNGSFSIEQYQSTQAIVSPFMKFLGNSKSHSALHLNLAANLTGSAWTMLVQVACIPLYIKFMGIEVYGLIGFYLMLQATLQILDLGLSPTMNREMARYSVHPEKAEEARDLVRTLEVGYWFIGISVGIALVAASPWVATHWIRASSVPVRSVRQAVALMGVLAVFQWPVSFYQGGLTGLRKQVLFNLLRIIASTLSNGGAVLVLWLVSRTIQAFFLWMVASNAVMVVLWTVFLWKSLPSANRAPQFKFDLIRNIGRFAAGMSGIATFSLVLGQADKIVLSKVLSLTVFGYYAIAGIFGTGLVMIVSSVFNTVFPQFSALVAQSDEEAIICLYHKATQLMLLLIVPLTSVLAFFSVEILQLWTRNPDVAHNAGPIATILVFAAAINGLMFLPFTLQLAYGWTGIGLKITIFLTIVVVPAIWFMAKHYGPVGAAFVCLGLQVVNMLVGVPLTHRRLLRHEMTKWFLQDIGPPLAGSVLVVGVARMLITSPMSPLATLAFLLAVLLAALAVATSLAPQIRGSLLTKLSSI
jgi:O-antigen/teichoic acid export membrane protein